MNLKNMCLYTPGIGNPPVYIPVPGSKLRYSETASADENKFSGSAAAILLKVIYSLQSGCQKHGEIVDFDTATDNVQNQRKFAQKSETKITVSVKERFFKFNNTK